MSARSKSRKIDPRLVRHLAAGAPALLLDIIGLEALLSLGWDVHLARALSITIATIAAFFLQRTFTYAPDQKARTIHGQPIPFVTLQASAGILSYGLFLRVLYTLPHPVGFAGRLFALLVGAAAGFFFNYLMLQRLLPVRAEKGPAFTKGSLPMKTIKRVSLWLVVICLTLQSVRGHDQLVMSWPGLKDPLGPFDPDPWVRLTQVRQWLMGGWSGFFDHTVHNINAPFGGVATPWTRPLDLLLALFYLFTPHNLAMNVRLMLSATWLPPAIGLGAIAFLTLAVRRHFNNLHALGFVALLVLFSPDTFNYFVPGDSDHHGLLSMLWCGVLAMLMKRDYDRRTALLAGAMLGLMIWISPEALILTAAVYGILALLCIRDARRMAGFAYTATGAALIATFGLFVEMPPHLALTQLVYDSLSIVQAVLLWLCACAAFALCAVFQRPMSAAARFFTASVAGALVLLAMYALYPRFFLGPLADVDPFILTGFLPRVGEAKSLLNNTWDDVMRELMEPLLAAALVIIALWRSYVRPERRLKLIILSLLLGLTTAMTLYQIRWAYYMHPVAIIIIGMLVAGASGMPKERPWVWMRYLPRQGRPYLIIWLAFFMMNFLIKLNPAVTTASSNCTQEIRYVVQTQQLQPLLGNKDLVLFVTEDAGGDVLFFTPYRIIASNYHREGKGLKDMHDIFVATSAKDAVPLLKKRKVEAMLYCPAFLPDDSWMAAAKDPKWLIPVNGLHFANPKGRKPVLFRIKGLQ